MVSMTLMAVPVERNAEDNNIICLEMQLLPIIYVIPKRYKLFRGEKKLHYHKESVDGPEEPTLFSSHSCPEERGNRYLLISPGGT